MNLLILGLFITAQFAANLFSVTHFIGFSSLESMRYFSSLFIFPLFWLSLFIIDLLIQHKKGLIVHLYLSLFIVYVFISILFLYKVKPGGTKNFLAYKPANVECVDEVVRKHNLKFG